VNKLFTADGAWHHTVYELEIELGPRSDEHLLHAMQALWDVRELTSPVAAREPEPEKQEPLSPEGMFTLGRAFWVATLADSSRVPCGTWVYRALPDSEVARDPEGTDWLHVFIPLGSLNKVWPEVGPYPFVSRDEDEFAHAAWQERIESWFLAVAGRVYLTAPYRLAVIGHEVPSEAQTWWRWQREGVPAEREEGMVLPRDDGLLAWYPPTRRGGWTLCDPAHSWADLFAGPPS
jgi:hypothetical protein